MQQSSRHIVFIHHQFTLQSLLQLFLSCHTMLLALHHKTKRTASYIIMQFVLVGSHNLEDHVISLIEIPYGFFTISPMQPLDLCTWGSTSLPIWNLQQRGTFIGIIILLLNLTWKDFCVCFLFIFRFCFQFPAGKAIRELLNITLYKNCCLIHS